jgi:O-antigen/teichoic acid export membrane protein
LVALLSARYLGPERFGVFSFSFAFVHILQMFAGGLSNVLVREIVQNRDRLEHVLSAAIPLMTTLSGLVWLISFLIVKASSVDAEIASTIYILTAALPASFNSAAFAAVCRAKEEMFYNALALVLQRVVLLSLVGVTVMLDFGLVGVASSYLAAHMVQWLFFSGLVSRRYCRYRTRIDVRLWRYLLLEGTPIALGMILQRIAWFADIFLLTLLSSTRSVGLYGAAYRLVEMLSVIPTALSIPVYPALSRLAVDSHTQAFSLYLKAQKFLIIIGLPVGVWVFVTAPQLMALLFGPEYIEATPALRILGLMLVLLFLNSLYLYLFSAIGAQRIFMAAMSFIVVLNIVLDVILIPALDFTGAALATLVSESTLYLIGSLLLLKKGVEIKKLLEFWKILPALLCALAVLAWPAFSPSFLSLILGSVGFGVVYLSALFLFDVIGKSELDILSSIMPGSKVKSHRGHGQ